MQRCIYKDALMKELPTMYKEPTSTEDYMTIGYDKAIADVVVTVHRQPIVDVRENVHAHLGKVEVRSGEWWHTCSKCMATWGSEDGELDFNYCPNCGAKMEDTP